MSTMADDPYARIAELEAELAASLSREDDLSSEVGRLRPALSEALEQQTATAEILRVIASSQADLTPVFDAVAQRAYRLCGGSSARFYLVDGDVCRIVAAVAESDDAAGRLGRLLAVPGYTERLSRESPTGRAALDRQVIHLEDTYDEDVRAEYPIAPTGRGYARTRLHVPLLRDGEAIGVIAV